MLESVEVLESKKVNTSKGLMIFEIVEERMGSYVKKFYTAQDFREGQEFDKTRDYKDEKGYRAAIKRYSKL